MMSEMDQGRIASLRQVGMDFNGHTVLHEVSFDLYPGEIVALMGPSGCGKTTVLRILIGLLEASRGELEIFGSPVREDTPRELLVSLRRRMGVVFQNGALFDSLTVGENVMFPLRHCLGMRDRDAMKARAQEILGAVELPGVEGKYPSELSGGMRKRVAIARSLVYRPELLLLDEPTTGLDPQTARHVDRLVRDLGRSFGIGVLVVTHDLVTTLGIAHRILLIDQGRISWRGSVEEWRRSTSPEVRRFARGMEPVNQREENSDA